MKRTELPLIAAIVLVVGLVAGGAIYVFGEDVQSATSYVIVGDTAYPVDPASTKAYVRQLERFGGKAAVVFDDFNRWFAGRWQGKALGVTIMWLTVFIALALFAIARKLGPERD